jgi:tetratricopeptide (TPR) repeat protein
MDVFQRARELLGEGLTREAEEALLAAVEAAEPPVRGNVAHQAGLLALKSGQPRMAVRLFQRAAELMPRSPEARHDLGLALLEVGDVGLAALAQNEAVLLDPEHVSARAQLAAALEALGDDAGAARELSELLQRLGPQPALSARLFALEEAARRAASRRLLGGSPSRISASPLVGTALARAIGEPHLWRAPFAELRARAESGLVERLDLTFASMDASMGRSDLSYGGSTLEDDGRRVPLDEFTAAGIVFLSESLGIETSRARRILSFLLTPEGGGAPQKLAGARIGWTITDANGSRKYGLYAEV